ncbi:hypothetical protein [Psychromicrobium xiongbiense]|uniref:hypothetical protein n=1 Tax=Psychromicrobium xiongbiense TaxID=3051184 RepID=UPI002555DCC1|nr:hypothetical protein [Psychromicrobium sp. YIM S02556]
MTEPSDRGYTPPPVYQAGYSGGGQPGQQTPGYPPLGYYANPAFTQGSVGTGSLKPGNTTLILGVIAMSACLVAIVLALVTTHLRVASSEVLSLLSLLIFLLGQCTLITAVLAVILGIRAVRRHSDRRASTRIGLVLGGLCLLGLAAFAVWLFIGLFVAMQSGTFG